MLADPAPVYRGCSRARVEGLSWTTDFELVRGFANGHRGIPVPKPVVAKANICKDGIFAIFRSRAESEIVLDPDELFGIKIMPLMVAKAA